MSTRSRIGMVMPNGTVKSIYNHSDGYLEGPHGAGFRLNRDYRDGGDKLAALIALGDRSTLDPGREYKGDNATEALISPNRDSFLAHREEYMYLFDAGSWHVWIQYGTEQERIDGVDLTQALVTERLTS